MNVAQKYIATSTIRNKNALDNSENDRFQVNPITTHDRFKELTHGYVYSFKGKNDRGVFTGSSEKKYVEMNEKRECSYQKTNFQGNHQETIPLNCESDGQSEGKKTFLLDDYRTNEDGPTYSTGKGILDQAQKWGITLRQVRAIMQNIERRCAKEKWTNKDGKRLLTPETVCMYHVYEKIILPFTEESQKSFVETLPSTKGPQLPRHYLSYTWRSPFKELVLMLEQFVEDFSRNHKRISDNQGGGMTDDTPIHISVFAINQWDLKKKPGGVIPFSEFSHGIAQILKLVNYRLITYLDQEGAIFERVWPIYDIFVTLMKSGDAGLWKIYIAHKHEDDDGNERNAVGLVPGGAPSDKYSIDTVLREKNFPIHLIERFIEYEVKNVQASSVNDRINFLNFLTDEDTVELDKDPPTEHSRYTEFQDAFRANFATPGTLQAALRHGDEHWRRMLNVMSKSNAPIDLRFNFESGKGWDELTDFQAIELIRSLPKTTQRLKIFHASYGTSFVKELSNWIKATKNLKTLRIEDTLIKCGIIDGQHKIIQELAKSLASIDGLERLEVWSSNHESYTFVEMVKTLIQSEKIAEAFFIKPLRSLYAEDDPDFNKIKSLQTAFVSTEKRFCDLPWQIKYDTVDWAQDLHESEKAELLQSRAGPFLKTILNERFSDKLNLSYIILNVIVRVVIVTLLSNGISNVTIFFIVWLCIIEVTQICISTVKDYISEVQNWVDLAQIVLLIILPIVSDSILGSDYLEFAILVSYLALIFSLGTIFFPLAQFVDALIEITKVLGPFLLTTILIVLAFANMFHTRYSNEECPINENEFEDADELSFIRNWACNSVFESFKRMLYMFLTDGNWYFDHKQSELLMALFAFVIGILLLNIVIAVVSNKFTDVQNDAEKIFWVRRLSLIKEVESLRTLAKKLFRVSDPNKNDPDKNDPDNRGTVCDNLVAMTKGGNGRKKRFSFNFIPLDDDYVDPKDIRLFFGWWFSPAEWGDTPRFPIRLRMFYLYSNWEDIVLPGKVFERILLSCSYKEDLEEDVSIIYFAKASMVRFLTWVAFFIHGLCILAIFVVGFASFGLLWPRPLVEWLFNRGMEEESESNTLIVKTYIQELNTKVDALTRLVNNTEEESNPILTEEKSKMDIFVEEFNAYVNTQTSGAVKMNTAVEEINTKVDAVEELSVKIDAQTSDAVKMNTIVGELSAKTDAQASNAVETNTVVGELSAKVGVLTSKADQMNTVVGKLSAKVGVLTSNSDQMNTVVGELSTKIDVQTSNADQMNTVVGELITKVDTLTTLMTNIENLLEKNVTPAPASELGSSGPSQAHSSTYQHSSKWRENRD